MGLNNRNKNGPNFVPAYEMSGIPYVTSSNAAVTDAMIDFPYVTRWVCVTNLGTNALKIGITDNGIQTNPTLHNFFIVASEY